MANYNPAIAKDYIIKIAGTSPRYTSFMQAQNLGSAIMEARKKSMMDVLREKHNLRLNLYQLFWNMYLGNHWFNYGNTQQDKPTPKQVNLCATAVDKHASFLMSKGFLVETNFEGTQDFLQKNWKLNMGGIKDNNMLGVNMALMGGVTGDVWLDMYLDKHEYTGEDFVKIDLLDSYECFPVLDRKKLIGLLNYGLYEAVLNENHGFPQYETVYEGFYLTKGAKEFIVNDEVVKTDTYDFTYLPLVHIQNMISPISYYGMSDLVNITDLNIAYNKLMDSMSDIIDYHSAPITVIKGAKAGDLVRGPNRVWFLSNKDASVSNLKLEGDLLAANNFIQKLYESILQSANLTQVAMGKDTGISNTSGTALAVTLMPLYEMMELKRISYGVGILNANTLMLKMAIMKGLVSPTKIYKEAIKKWEQEFSNYDQATKDKFYPFAKTYRTDANFDSPNAIINNTIPPEIYESYVTWFPPLPRDEKVSSDMAIANVSANLWSKRHARSYMGMSERESLLQDKEIEADYEAMSNLDNLMVTNVESYMRKYGNNKNGGNNKGKTGLEGNPDVKGNKESLRREMEEKKE